MVLEQTINHQRSGLRSSPFNLLKPLVCYCFSQAHDLTTAIILGWCIDLASVLVHLHEECSPPIVHRDLKLENIMLTARE